jgi:hypothetical protein
MDSGGSSVQGNPVLTVNDKTVVPVEGAECAQVALDFTAQGVDMVVPTIADNFLQQGSAQAGIPAVLRHFDHF